MDVEDRGASGGGAASGGGGASGPDSAEMKRAMKAFRKRIKLMRLDDESGIAGRAMSSGRESGIVAITPPSGYSQAVWDALVKQGRLREVGGGTYEIVGD